MFRILSLRRTQRAHDRQSGSVMVLTLLALGMIVGAFFYVAVIGGRVSETLRIRTAADAAALAAATTKARSLNYASFLLMAETVLMPLSDVAQNIATVEAANQSYAICAAMRLVDGMQNASGSCLEHVLRTAPNSHAQYLVIQDILSALSATAEGLDTIGPLWAESVAVQTARNPAYSSGTRPIDQVAVFPALTGDPQCGRLGVETVTGDTPTGPEARKACASENAWELAYVAMSMDLTQAGMDAWAWQAALGETSCAKVANPAKELCNLIQRSPELLTANGPTKDLQKKFSVQDLNDFFKLRKDYEAQVQDQIPAMLINGPGPQQTCNQATRVPQLAADWFRYTRSIAMTRTSRPSDGFFVPRMESLRRGKQGSIPTGSPLGMACAEHYTTDTSKTTSLWTIGWRARLVPCNFSDPANVHLVMDCGGRGGAIGDQFQRELDLGIARDWKY